MSAALVDTPGAAELVLDVLQALRPPPKLTASQWAEANLVLPRGVSARPGPLKLNTWQKQLVDAVAHEDTRTAVLMLASQVGKSLAGDVLVAHMMAQSPGPALLVHPTSAKAADFVRTRLDPIIRATPVLRNIVGGGRKGGGDALGHKLYPGGSLALGSSFRPDDLAARAIEFLFLDEVDRFAESAGREGDPVELAVKRTHTYSATRKVIVSSTPTHGQSRIAAWFDQGDQRRYMVPCPECGTFDWLRLDNLKWDQGRFDTARLRCSSCKHGMGNRERIEALDLGEWRATADSASPGLISFHGTVLLSDFVTLSEIAETAERAETNPEKRRVFQNTSAAEPYRADEGEPLDASTLAERAEPVRAPFSADSAFVSAGVDVQSNRLEVTFLGQHAKNNISTVLNHLKIMGDTSGHAVWQALDEVLGAPWPLADGRVLPTEITGVDSGFNTELVAQFCAAQQAKGRRVVAVKGVSGFDKPAVRVSKNVLRGTTTQFNIGVDVVKEQLMARLRMREFGPGYIHLADHLDPSYFAGLAGEKIDTMHVRGYARRSFVKIIRSNEPLDCLCYAAAVATRVKLPDNTSPAQPTSREIGAAFNKLRQPEAEQPTAERYSGV